MIFPRPAAESTLATTNGHTSCRTLLHLPELWPCRRDRTIKTIQGRAHSSEYHKKPITEWLARPPAPPSSYNSKFSKAGELQTRDVEPLSAVSVPDRAGRFVIPAFAPNCVGCSFAVNRDAEIIAERKTKAAGKNIVVAVQRP